MVALEMVWQKTQRDGCKFIQLQKGVQKLADSFQNKVLLWVIQQLDLRMLCASSIKMCHTIFQFNIMIAKPCGFKEQDQEAYQPGTTFFGFQGQQIQQSTPPTFRQAPQHHPLQQYAQMGYLNMYQSQGGATLDLQQQLQQQQNPSEGNMGGSQGQMWQRGY